MTRSRQHATTGHTVGYSAHGACPTHDRCVGTERKSEKIGEIVEEIPHSGVFGNNSGGQRI